MIPSIFEYLPKHAEELFQKVAGPNLRMSDEGAETPDFPAEPRVEPPPQHPYVTGLKQLVPIGAGMAAGYALGAGGPHLYEKYVTKIPRTPQFYHTLGGISAIAGGVGGIAANILNQSRQAEADRANQEYQDYFARSRRREGSSADPTVQPPPVR
jgi:hypothetical protein